MGSETTETVYRIDDKAYWQTVVQGSTWAAPMVEFANSQGVRTAIHVLGDPEDERTPVGVFVEYPPNHVLPRHSHDCKRMEVVVRGSVEVDGYWLGAGDIWVSDANEFYGPHTMGPEGATTLELATVRGARTLTFDTPNGPLVVDFSDPGTFAAAAAAFE